MKGALVQRGLFGSLPMAVVGMVLLYCPIMPCTANVQTRPSKAVLSALQEAFAAIAEEVEPAVVTIITQRTVRLGAERAGPEGEGQAIPHFLFGREGRPRAYRARGTGSGVIISADGWVLTNDHVVGRADKVMVRLQDGREFQAQVRRDYRSDLALLKIEGERFPFARLGDSDQLKVGHWAIAIGSPYRYEGSFSVGVISALYRQQIIDDSSGEGEGRLYPDMIQTDAAINPGNSGGPLVNLDGEVVGINTAIETNRDGGSVGIGFAIPINTAKFVIDQLRRSGKVSYGFLGVEPETLSPRLASAYKVLNGVLVRSEPKPDSPAGRAGIQVDDIITQIGTTPIRTERDLRLTISRTAPGTKIPVKLVRDGVEKIVMVVIEEAPDPLLRRANQVAGTNRLGIEVEPLTPEAAKRVGLTERDSGVLIKSLESGTSAAESELLPGDVILRANNVPTPNVDAFNKFITNLKSGDLLRIRWQGVRGSQIVRKVAIITID
ncbi:MAG TPA: trypsin-like peptidase domain-containing protein [Chthonomonadales bacterium]|nr:trypsin-like peptidase domain-containing protein [Chthonomonadales bacterium]